MTAGHASAGEAASALPGSLRANPRLSRWLRFAPDGTVEISPGKVEIGQGILTALAQIAADELDVDLAAIRLKPATTGLSPNEGVTSGSLSVHDCGLAVRTACAAARGLFLAAAAARLGVPAEALAVENGTIAGPGNARSSYAELSGQVSLDIDLAAPVPVKAPAGRRVAGTGAARLHIELVRGDLRQGRQDPLPDLDLSGRDLDRAVGGEAQPAREARSRAQAAREGARRLPGGCRRGGHAARPSRAARRTARTMRFCAPQRHRLRSRAARTSASVGSGRRRSRAAALIRMPEMQ